MRKARQFVTKGDILTGHARRLGLGSW